MYNGYVTPRRNESLPAYIYVLFVIALGIFVNGNRKYSLYFVLRLNIK